MWHCLKEFIPSKSKIFRKSNQGNQGYNGNQKNAIQGQRPDIHNTEHKVTKIIHTK